MAEKESPRWKQMGKDILLTADKIAAWGTLAFGIIAWSGLLIAYGAGNVVVNRYLENKFGYKKKQPIYA